MPTSKQLAMIHIEAARAGLIEKGNRMPFNNLLRNIGGVGSSKDLGQAAFEDCMAVIEDCAEGKGLRAGRYWRDKVILRGSVANPRMTAKIHALAKDSRYKIGALCLRFSDDRTWAPEKLYPREAWQLIEMLKASNAREAKSERAAAQQALFSAEQMQPLRPAKVAPPKQVPAVAEPGEIATGMGQIGEEPF